MAFLLCYPGWDVHKPDVQNKLDDNTELNDVFCLNIGYMMSSAGYFHARFLPSVCFLFFSFLFFSDRVRPQFVLV